jgi:hypothetical protein
MSPAITVLLAFAVGASPAAEARMVEFLGFSSNEALAAWKIKVVRPTADGHCRDEFSLIRIVDAGDNRVMGELKSSEPRRRPVPGAKGACALGDFDDRNPDWAAASPRREWEKLRSRGAFFAKALELNDNLVHLSKDSDAPSEMIGVGKRITVTGRPASPVGYAPVIRLVTGVDVTLGHARREGVAGKAWVVEIKVYHSRSANHVALLHRFGAGGDEPIWLGRSFRLPDPVATLGVGAIRILQTEDRLAEKDFKELHPDLSGEYEELVGTTPNR